MKSTLPATHLLRIFAIFALAALFLLTLTRAGFSLWQLHRIESVEGFNTLQGFAEIFVTGWRFDLALIGAILFIPVTLGTLLAMLGPLRVLGRLVITLFMFFGMLLILLGEYITPYFLHLNDSRPDLASVQAIEDPTSAFAGLWSTQMIPAIIGLVLGILILIAFMSRLELSRLLRYRISVLSGIPLMIIGGLLCLFAMISSIEFMNTPTELPNVLHPNDALISTETLVNELSLNTAYNAGWSLIPVSAE